jgi:hypothetical protein
LLSSFFSFWLLTMDPSAGIPGVTHCNAIQAAHGKSCDRAFFFFWHYWTRTSGGTPRMTPEQSKAMK